MIVFSSKATWTSNLLAFVKISTAGKQTSVNSFWGHSPFLVCWTLQIRSVLARVDPDRVALHPSLFSGRGPHDLGGNPNVPDERRGLGERWVVGVLT